MIVAKYCEEILFYFPHNLQAMRTYREYFRRNSIPKEFEYRNANDYDIQISDDEQTLQQKLIGDITNIRILCGSYLLYDQNSLLWNSLCNQLLQTREQNPKLQSDLHGFYLSSL